MDDGEAQTLALASSRGVPALSDDLALARVALLEEVTVITALDVLAEWQATQNVPIDELAAAAYAMYRRANYAAPRAHPRRAWYLGLIISKDDS